MACWFLRILALSAAISFAGCRREVDTQGVEIASVSFDQVSLTVEFTKECVVERLDVLDDKDLLLRSRRPSPTPRRRCSAVLEWTPGARYRVVAWVRGKGSVRRTVTAPAEPLPPADLEISFPAGVGIQQGGVSDETRRWIPREASFDVGARVRSYCNEEVPFTLRVELPAGVVPPKGGPLRFRQGDDSHFVAALSGTVPFQLTDRSWTLPLKLSPSATPGEEFELRFECEFVLPHGRSTQTVGRSLRLVVKTAEEFSSRLEIRQAQIPTSRDGSFDPRRRQGTIVLPNRLGNTLRRLLGMRAEFVDYDHPFTYQTVTLSNDSSATLPLLVRGNVLDRRTLEPATEFAPAGWLSTAGSGATSAPVMVGPGASAQVVLPVFVGPDAIGGRYVRRIEVVPLGTQRPILVSDFPLEVASADVGAFLVCAAAVVLSGLGVLLLGVSHRQLFERIPLRSLITIALFATAAFIGIGVPSVVAFGIVQVLLGPYAPLVTGLLTQGLGAVLLVALVMLIPRKGVVGLAFLFRFILTAILLGGFSIVTALYSASAAVLIEAALLLSGVTRKRALLSDYPRRRWLKGVVLATCMATAVGIAELIQLSLLKTLFRFYLSDQYVWLTVLVVGCFYTWMGVWGGLSLGLSLRKVAE